MEVFGATTKLTKILSDDKKLQRKYGKLAPKIQLRLDEFKNADTLSQIPIEPPPRCHLLTGKFERKFAVDVSANFRLIFEGYDRFDQLSIDRSEIVSIQIIDITDYH